MPLRIAVGGFQHESHSFAPRPTSYSDFLAPGGWPPLCRGPAMLRAMANSSTTTAGALPVLAASGAELVPLLWCIAMPAGPVQDEAFERIAAMLVADLGAALDASPVDGLFLDLHGAALTDTFPDAEGELLRRVRAVAGARMPLVITLDPHANLTAKMVALADAIVPYRTYPHIDQHESGAHAANLLLARLRRGAPWAKAFRQLDYWFTLSAQCTMTGPMRKAMEERAAIAARHRVAELAFCFGFPYADFADCGAAVACTAETQGHADAAVNDMIAWLVAHEDDFQPDAVPAPQAVSEALSTAAGATRPVVVADTQDNPGGGGHGDTTGLLAELIAQHARGAVVCFINDAEYAAACHAAGEGTTVALPLGGRSDGVPLTGQARVLRLGHGSFPLTGPMGQGNMANLGPTALVEFPPGIRVIVTSRKIQAADQAILRHLGVEPAHCPIIVLKSSVHFRADFEPIAERIIIAAAPGPVIADPSTLPFGHVRASVRKRAGGRS